MGIFVAQDTGSSIKGNRIDIFMDTHEEAFKFGCQNLKIYIIKENQKQTPQI
jgi:3D (Asp-Asp-Asp) domain-containing protein